jgi:hypothetical protein
VPILTIRYCLPSDPVQSGENGTANPQTGTGLLSVTFTDTSSHTPSSWSWAYKNATVGWTQLTITPTPSFVFLSGTYDINLPATNPLGSDSLPILHQGQLLPMHGILAMGADPLNGTCSHLYKSWSLYRQTLGEQCRKQECNNEKILHLGYVT